MPATKFPEAEISNKMIKAKLYLPDKEKGYYQGTRFDWSGNMPSLKVNGHEYFGQWFEKYSPEIHDAIWGPWKNSPRSTIWRLSLVRHLLR
ncbi:MAG: hypothetical protein HZB98_04345 [Bacteroidia bacterium]|nr:hypothetical protein [Bacteroidia bacterium]